MKARDTDGWTGFMWAWHNRHKDRCCQITLEIKQNPIKNIFS